MRLGPAVPAPAVTAGALLSFAFATLAGCGSDSSGPSAPNNPVPDVTITTTGLPAGTLGVAYSESLSASGGTGSFSWNLVSGTLPDGLALNSSGVVSGKPTADGNFDFTVQASSGGKSGTKALSVEVEDPGPALPILYTTPDGALVATDLTGSVSDTIFFDPTYYDVQGVWSPTGTHIAVRASVGGRIGDGGVGKLFVMHRDSSTLRVVSDVPDNVVGKIDWSSDGSRLVFRTDNNEIYIVGVDGSGHTHITPGLSLGSRPDLSPDGEWVVFWGGVDAQSGIGRVRTDGTGAELLREWEGDYWEIPRPEYSPDGLSIAFEAGRELFLMDADGGNPRPLTNTPTTHDWFPRFSPDGSRIAFHVDTGGNWGIGIMDLATGAMIDTLGVGEETADPDWGPDSNSMVFRFAAAVAIQEIGAASPTLIVNGRRPSWNRSGNDP